MKNVKKRKNTSMFLGIVSFFVLAISSCIKNYVITMLAVLLLFLGSCSKDTTNNDRSNDTQVLDKGSYTFQKSAVTYNEAKEKRSEEYSAPFEISKIERVGDSLNITLSYLQGCEESKFDVIWDGIVNFTYPATIVLIVKRSTGNCGALGDTIKQVLSIDLVECIGDSSFIKDANILVSNASKKPNSDNSDVIISNKN